jgi:beta-glucosidase
VRNAGPRRGADVIQVYVRDVGASDVEPDKTLRQFARVELDPAQSLPVTLDLPRRAFEHWDPERHAWALKPGEREILVGASSRDIRLTARWSVAT